MSNRLTYPLVLTAFLVFFSHGMAKADCYTQCDADYASCNHNCPQCPCYETYQACFDGCQYADTDHDGITDSNDNCTETYNPNQADCDDDGTGNACDYQDNSWTLFSIGNSYCAFEGAWKLGGREIRLYTANLYRSACTGTLCYKRVQKVKFSCGSYSESDDFDCCRVKMCSSVIGPCAACTSAWNNNCGGGYPYCPF